MKNVSADRVAEERALATEFKEGLAGLDRYIPAAPALSLIEPRSRIRWAPSRRGSARPAIRLGATTALVAVLIAVALAGSWGLGGLHGARDVSRSALSDTSAATTATPPNSPEASASHVIVSQATPLDTPAVVRFQPPIPTDGKTTAAAPWYAYEVNYLNLMNCTRTGGWVTSDGECSSDTNHTLPAQAPLVLDAGLSDKVARPYAKLLADRKILDHNANGTPEWRLCDIAGFCDPVWGENMASPQGSMVAVEIFYQNEYQCRCQHYSNIMNPRYHRVGIGVWNSSGNWRLVVEFYD